jgi:uncharacterized damage-inducible protein DinB
MRIAVRAVMVCMLAGGCSAWAQGSANPVVASAQEIVGRQGPYIIAAAEAMAPEKYGYHPTADQWSFGKIVSHVVQANDKVCAMLTDKPAPTDVVTDTMPKDKLVPALKASLDYCNAAFAQLKDSQLGDTITYFGGVKKPRARALMEVVADLEDHYSQMAGYLRLNGMVPPSVKPKK